MKKMKILMYMISAAAILSACCRETAVSPADRLESLLQSSVSEGKILFGQQDAFMYGHSWRGGSGSSPYRSDVADVCGKHPAVLGLDLGGIELGNGKNLDGNDFGFMRQVAVDHYLSGGIVTLSWHPRNPLTGGDSWDVSSDDVVASILEGGEKHGLFMDWLSSCADYLESFRDEEGNAVPMIFRPWHEHTGSWFWWGRDLCTAEQYRALWRMTYSYMTGERGLDNLLWAYSPGAGVDAEGYMERYPGDDMADMFGLDCYQYGDAPESNAAYSALLHESLTFMMELGKEHGKLIALTETGFEGIPYPEWWTEVLYPVIKDYPLSYVLVWRNACDKPGHFYAPWPGQKSAADFVKFAENGNIVLMDRL